jgi:hypothetical protein
MLGPAPSASGEPSIWYDAVAQPHKKSRAKVVGVEVMGRGPLKGHSGDLMQM